MGKRGPKKRKLDEDVETLNLSKSQDRDKKRDERAKEDPVARYLRVQAEIVRRHKKHQQELAAEKVARIAAENDAKKKSRRAEPAAKKKSRLAKQQKKQSASRASESKKAKGKRLEGQKKKQSDSRASESDQAKALRLEGKKKKQSDSRASESDQAKALRLEGQKKKQSDSRASESDEATTVRKSRDKARKSIERRLAETRLKRAQAASDELPVTSGSDLLEAPSPLKRRRTDDNASAADFELDPDSLTPEFFEDAANDFQSRLWSIQNVSCPNCKERFPDIKLNIKTGFCGKCTKNKDKYTTRNNMDPGIQPEELIGLTTVESILISRIVPNMCVYRLPHGQYGYSGNVINIPQDVESIATVLPRVPTDVNVLVLRKTGQSGTCKDFRVRRARVYAALKWLCRHNIYYDDVNISDEHLSMLPDDGELTFPSIVEDETDPNNQQFDDDSESDYDLAELLDSFDDCPADDPRDDLADGYLAADFPADSPRADASPTGVPRADAYPTGAPRADASPTSAPQADASPTGAPRADASPTSAPQADASPTDAHRTAVGCARAAEFDSTFIPVVLEKQTEKRRKDQDVQQVLGGDQNNPVDWPTMDVSNPINEFNTVGYIVQAFPELFGLVGDEAGGADSHESARPLTPVTLLEYFQHLLRYDDGRFAKHNRFRYFALNTILRHRAMVQGRMFVRQNPDEARLTIEELLLMAQNERNELLNKIKRYGASLPGSAQYWGARRQELLQFIKFKQKLPTIFFTLSSADLHWPELHRLLPGYSSRSAAVIDNPMMCDWFFIQRVQFIMDTVFKRDLKMTDFWYRFENQKRGSIHCHGVAYDDNAPDVTEILKVMCDVNTDYSEYVKYYDELISTVNPGLDISGNGDLPHFPKNPATVPYFRIKPEDKESDYLGIVIYCHTHTCRRSYCQKAVRPGPVKCRFDFPFPLAPESKIEIVEDEKTSVKTVKFVSKRNDPKINTHNPRVATTFRSNTDMQAVVDKNRVVGYCTKYICKPESRSDSMTLLSNAALSAAANPQDPVRQIAQKTLIKTIGDRDYSSQETMHILNGYPEYRCSRTFVPLHLTGERELAQENGEPLLVSTPVDKYTQRPAAYEEYSMTLFYTNHFFGAHGRVGDRRQSAVVPKGMRKVDRSNSRFEDYARKFLMLHKPFRNTADLLGTATTYTEAYDLFIKHQSSSEDLFDLEEDVRREQPNTDNIDADSDILACPLGSRLPTEFTELLQANPDFANHPTTGSSGTDWTQIYRDNVDLYEAAREFQDNAGLNVNEGTDADVDPDLMNEKQREVYDEVAMHLHTRSQDPSSKPLRKIVTGTAGTGKSFVINCLKQLLGSKCLLLAPTGVAACNIKGQTANSALRIPIVSPRNFTELRGPGLEDLQERLREVEYVIIEEMSMIGLSKFRMIDLRLRQAFPSHSEEIFGGRSFILIGDFGQLPPPADLRLYSLKPKNEFQKAGALIYRSIKSCTILECAVRQENDRQLYDILQRLRNGTLTDSDYDVLKSRFFKGWNARNNSFKDAVHLFAKRADVNKHNADKLAKLNSPLAAIHAEHTGGCVAKKASIDDACGLDSFLMLAKGAKIMLTANLNVKAGLCNGSQGTIEEIVYKEGGPPGLPFVVLCRFPSYTGESFMPNRSNIFPVMPITRRFTKSGVECTRTMLPLNLAWAITIHKSQGLTLDQVYLDIGAVEFALGLSFVGMSRVRSLSQLLLNPFPKHRLLGGDAATISKTIKRAIGIELLQNEDIRLSKMAAGTLTPESNISFATTAADSVTDNTDMSEHYLLPVPILELPEPLDVEPQPSWQGVAMFVPAEEEIFALDSPKIPFRPLTETDRMNICSNITTAITYVPAPLLHYQPEENQISHFQGPSHIQNVQGDGHCFYHAVSLAVSNSTNFDNELRDCVVDYVLRNPDVMNDVGGPDMTREVVANVMNMEEAFEGVARAMAFALGCSIYIYIRNVRYVWVGYHPNDTPTHRAIYLFSCNGEGHRALGVTAPNHFALVTHV